MNLTNELKTVLDKIPSGIGIYKIEDGKAYPVFYNSIFNEVLGFSDEYASNLEKALDFSNIHPEDSGEIFDKAEQLLDDVAKFHHTVRVYNKKIAEYRWIHIEGSLIRQDGGEKLAYVVYTDVTDQKHMENETVGNKAKIDHLVNSIPGGIASYLISGSAIKAVYVSDGAIALSGYTREEYEKIAKNNTMDFIYEADRARVFSIASSVVKNGHDANVSCRLRQKNGSLTWVHMNGRRFIKADHTVELSVVITGMSAETHLFQTMATEAADGIYVIDRDNYDLLYANEHKSLFLNDQDYVGKKCYEVLHGRTSVCENCSIACHAANSDEYTTSINDRIFSARSRESNWNGIPAYISYITDTTEAEKLRLQKAQIENYFHNVLRRIPGGVAVISVKGDGTQTPEFLSDGFAAMTGMSLDEAWDIYRDDAMAGIHPDDKDRISQLVNKYILSGDDSCEFQYRLVKGDGSYVWVNNRLTLLQTDGDESHIYAIYHDMTKELKEKRLLRRQYKELILQHYKTLDSNTLILGHCNITRGEIQDIVDNTDCDLLNRFGSVRDTFFKGVGSFIVDSSEREAFMNTFLSKPSLDAFEKNETEISAVYFVKFPKDENGRYARFRINMIATPDSQDITGILTVTDVTESYISDRILQEASISGYDFIVDLDLFNDCSRTLISSASEKILPPKCTSHSLWTKKMLQSAIVPKDRELYSRSLDTAQMIQRLKKDGAYTFFFSMFGDDGNIFTKKMTITPIDLRIGRVCMTRSDITDSVREQQGLLNMMAYTFERMAFIDIKNRRLTVHTRKTVLENLPPFKASDYFEAISMIANPSEEDNEAFDIKSRLELESMLQSLAEKPGGYDFVFAQLENGTRRYKQLNIMWGDSNYRTICIVRADVTDILVAERKSKTALENALVIAEDANRAKSDFLTSMSHDIRTPLNAIMGMTALAAAHQDNPLKVQDCLQKISASSKHLLSLINDVLDMSKIEHGQVSLNKMPIYIPGLLRQIEDIIAPQARSANLTFSIHAQGLENAYIHSDPLRINQILLNLLSNAIKFTPKGGTVQLLAEALPIPADSSQISLRFTVKDTGIGIPETFFEKIFQPFSRSRLSAKVEGTGLGLSITKGLVDLMGGSITVDSCEGQGTTFRVDLTYERALETDLLPGFSTGGVGTSKVVEKPFVGRRFLIVDDNAINAEILCELLEMYGAECVIKDDGLKAYDIFKHSSPNTFDAILMDIQMPEMDGYTATRAIRRLDKADAKSIPILAMTANAFAEDVQASLDAGMNEHISKPVDLEILRRKLSEQLENHDKIQ